MYIIKKTEKIKLDLFDKEWENANVADIAVINWKEFSYAPKTTAKTQAISITAATTYLIVCNCPMKISFGIKAHTIELVFSILSYTNKLLTPSTFTFSITPDASSEANAFS